MPGLLHHLCTGGHSGSSALSEDVFFSLSPSDLVCTLSHERCCGPEHDLKRLPWLRRASSDDASAMLALYEKYEDELTVLCGLAEALAAGRQDFFVFLVETCYVALVVEVFGLVVGSAALNDAPIQLLDLDVGTGWFLA